MVANELFSLGVQYTPPARAATGAARRPPPPRAAACVLVAVRPRSRSVRAPPLSSGGSGGQPATPAATRACLGAARRPNRHPTLPCPTSCYPRPVLSLPRLDLFRSCSFSAWFLRPADRLHLCALGLVADERKGSCTGQCMTQKNFEPPRRAPPVRRGPPLDRMTLPSLPPPSVWRTYPVPWHRRCPKEGVTSTPAGVVATAAAAWPALAGGQRGTHEADAHAMAEGGGGNEGAGDAGAGEERAPYGIVAKGGAAAEGGHGCSHGVGADGSHWREGHSACAAATAQTRLGKRLPWHRVPSWPHAPLPPPYYQHDACQRGRHCGRTPRRSAATAATSTIPSWPLRAPPPSISRVEPSAPESRMASSNARRSTSTSV